MDKEETRRKVVNIIQDKKQTRVAIPTEIVAEFDINSNKDKFEWIVIENEEGISLVGALLKNNKNEKRT